MLLIAVVNRAFLLLLDLKKTCSISYEIKMCYEFQELLTILPKLNSAHKPNNEHIQLVDKTFLQSLERLFLSPT